MRRFSVGIFVWSRKTSRVNSAHLGEVSENRLIVANLETWRASL